MAEMAIELVVGVLPDAAGVEHPHGRRFQIVRRDQSVGRQHAGDPLGIVFVHLAAEGTDVETTGHPPIVRRRLFSIRPDASPGLGHARYRVPLTCRSGSPAGTWSSRSRSSWSAEWCKARSASAST